MSDRNRDDNREQHAGCCCASLQDLAVVPMGGEGMDERVFATLATVCEHGGDQWWLYLSKCSACGQTWMVAQEERIFDDFFLRRMTAEQARSICEDGSWPDEFLTYEALLKTGRDLSQPCIYLDSMSSALFATAEDLRKARPDITVEEVAYLLGITSKNARRLLAA